jgi:hypothetical protein
MANVCRELVALSYSIDPQKKKRPDSLKLSWVTDSRSSGTRGRPPRGTWEYE